VKRVRVLIVEDDELQCEKLENLAEDLGYEVVQTADTAGKAINLINSVQPDVVLMDIDLNDDMDGIDVVEKTNQNTDFALIYITSLADYNTVQKLQTTDPDAYLIKPVSEPQLKAAVELAVLKRTQNQKLLTQDYKENMNCLGGVLNKAIFVKIGETLKKFDFDEIYYFQAAKDKYCDIVMKEKSVVARTTLAELEELLPAEVFIRVHRSILVNMKHISTVNRNFLILNNELKLPLGKTYKSDLYAKMRIVG